jgi:hypothetical protein
MLNVPGISKSALKADSTTAFEKAVVVEVNNSPQDISAGNTGLAISVNRIPRNSIIARRIGDVSGNPLCLCYPFFSSHIQLPVKAGETVWVYFDSPVKSIGYWISRIHGDSYAEDANYSHFDRSLIDPVEEGQSIGLAEKSGKAEMPSYQDFPNNSLTQTDSTSDNEGSPDDTLGVVDEYQKIINESTSIKSHSLEPVPRISKKTGDLVVQGSNNSAIILGTSRGRTKEQETFDASDSVQASSAGSGCIDIVAGRSFTTGLDAARRTSYEVYSNSREFSETLKDPDRKGLTQSLSEGDPDFYDDAARVYVSMKCASDVEFSLIDSLPYSFERAEDNKEVDYGSTSAVVIKSDNVRVIARKDDTTGRINGSIKLVKEGLSAEDSASVMLLPSGLVQITGSSTVYGFKTLRGLATTFDFISRLSKC